MTNRPGGMRRPGKTLEFEDGNHVQGNRSGTHHADDAR